MRRHEAAARVRACQADRQVQEGVDECLEGLRWLLTATAERLASPDDPAREALLRHLHRLASQALQQASRSG